LAGAEQAKTTENLLNLKPSWEGFHRNGEWRNKGNILPFACHSTAQDGKYIVRGQGRTIYKGSIMCVLGLCRGNG